MNILKYNSAHLQNIKDRFEEKTGVVLTAKPHQLRTRRLVVVICVAMFCLVAAIPIMANPAFYEFFYFHTHASDELFMSVNKTDVQNGIEMEIVSYYFSGDTAEIYVTLRDLTSDRIDETTDLLNSYSMDAPFSFGGCSMTDFDEETKTATFLISLGTQEGQDISTGKITFSLREFMSRKHTYEDVNVPVVLSVESTATQQVESYGWADPYGFVEEMELEWGSEKGLPLFTALIPEVPRGFSVEGMDLSGVGYIDGMLHIQTAVIDYATNDNHGFFYLKDEKGNRVDYSYSFSFQKQMDGTDVITYSEDVFDVPLDEIDQYTLHGDFYTGGPVIQGDWQVTFYVGE